MSMLLLFFLRMNFYYSKIFFLVAVVKPPKSISQKQEYLYFDHLILILYFISNSI